MHPLKNIFFTAFILITTSSIVVASPIEKNIPALIKDKEKLNVKVLEIIELGIENLKIVTLQKDDGLKFVALSDAQGKHILSIPDAIISSDDKISKNVEGLLVKMEMENKKVVNERVLEIFKKYKNRDAIITLKNRGGEKVAKKTTYIVMDAN